MKKRMKSASAAVIASVLIMGNLWGTTGDLGTAKAAEFSPVTEEQQKLWDKMEEEQKAGYNPIHRYLVSFLLFPPINP